MDLKTALTIFLAPFKTTTATSYRLVLDPFMDYIGPARPLVDISPQHIAEYIQVIQKRDYAIATRAKHAKTVKTFFNWCVKQGFLEQSPARIWTMPRVPRNITRDKAMTDDELEAILQYLRWKPRHYAVMLFLADTGCRISGAAGLTIDRLHLDQLRAIVIEKGDKARPVIFGDDTAEAIRIWLAEAPRKNGPYVFSTSGQPILPDALSQMIRRACQKVGVRTLSGHSLRHRKGHQLADAHVAPSIAATALGHSDPNITFKHYYPADWETTEMEMRKLAVKTSKSTIPAGKIVRFPDLKSS